MKTFILSVLGQRPHVDGVFGLQKRSFSKTLSSADLFENAVFMLSCGRVKMELFENADLTASIYDVRIFWDHVHGSFGITQGHFDCLFSVIKARTEELECGSVFVWTGMFSKALLVYADIFYTDKNRCVFINIRIRVDGA